MVTLFGFFLLFLYYETCPISPSFLPTVSGGVLRLTGGVGMYCLAVGGLLVMMSAPKP